MSAPPIDPLASGSAGPDARLRVKEILAAVKPLAAEYYRLTGKPLVNRRGIRALTHSR